MSQGSGLPTKNCPERHSAGLPLSRQVLPLTEPEGGFSSFPWASCLLSLALTWTIHPAGDTLASLPNHVLPFVTIPLLRTPFPDPCTALGLSDRNQHKDNQQTSAV